MTTTALPTWVAALELGQPFGLEPVTARDQRWCQSARVLVRLHGDPIGFLDVPVPRAGLTAEQVRRLAWDRFAGPLRAHLTEDGIALPSPSGVADLGTRAVCQAAIERAWARPLSVVVCTRDRPETLRVCLQSITGLRYPDFEVLVVDNAPSDEATRRSFVETVGTNDRFRYLREMAPGLSRARNRGLAEAGADHVAFTDDDVIVDPWWLHGIARGFARRADVGCVTGLVPSATLDNPAQHYFDRRVSWSAHLRPRLVAIGDPGSASPLFPFDAGSLGTGANFAIERDLASRVGGFDEALGAGTRSRGGEDLDMFVRVLREGRAIAWEPSAIVWHRHRTDPSTLRHQMSDFGVGLGAYVTKQLTDPDARRDLLRRVPHGIRHMLTLWRAAGSGPRRDGGLILAEMWGMARGPLAYSIARRAARNQGRAR